MHSVNESRWLPPLKSLSWCLRKYSTYNVSFFLSDYTWDRNFLYPSKEDLTGAAVAIARLQRTYMLNTTDLADGKLVATYRYICITFFWGTYFWFLLFPSTVNPNAFKVPRRLLVELVQSKIPSLHLQKLKKNQSILNRFRSHLENGFKEF